MFSEWAKETLRQMIEAPTEHELHQLRIEEDRFFKIKAQEIRNKKTSLTKARKEHTEKFVDRNGILTMPYKLSEFKQRINNEKERV